MKKKRKSIPTTPPKEDSNLIMHISSYEATMQNKPYIIPASKPGSYSKLEKAEKREVKKLKKELKDYTHYDA